MKNFKTIAALTIVVASVLTSVLIIDVLISTSTGIALLVIGLSLIALTQGLIPRKLTPIFIVLVVGVLTQLFLLTF